MNYRNTPKKYSDHALLSVKRKQKIVPNKRTTLKLSSFSKHSISTSSSFHLNTPLGCSQKLPNLTVFSQSRDNPRRKAILLPADSNSLSGYFCSNLSRQHSTNQQIHSPVSTLYSLYPSSSKPSYSSLPLKFGIQFQHHKTFQIFTPQISHFSTLFYPSSSSAKTTLPISLLDQVIHPPGLDEKFIAMISKPTPTSAQRQAIDEINPELKEKLEILISPETKAHFDAPLTQPKLQPTKDNIIHPNTADQNDLWTQNGINKEILTPMMTDQPILHPHQVPIQRGPTETISDDTSVEIVHPSETIPDYTNYSDIVSPHVQVQPQLQIIPKVARVRVRVGVKEREQVQTTEIVVHVPT